MARVTIDYTINLGDEVVFVHDGIKTNGVVQDLTWLPEVWIETGEPRNVIGMNAYRRYCIQLNDIISIEKKTNITYDSEENLAFIHVDSGLRKIITASTCSKQDK